MLNIVLAIVYSLDLSTSLDIGDHLLIFLEHQSSVITLITKKG